MLVEEVLVGTRGEVILLEELVVLEAVAMAVKQPLRALLVLPILAVEAVAQEVMLRVLVTGLVLGMVVQVDRASSS
jgi:predicted membrane-bound dolichyl-phosphate-mannose-protein mannosyltransferase